MKSKKYLFLRERIEQSDLKCACTSPNVTGDWAGGVRLRDCSADWVQLHQGRAEELEKAEELPTAVFCDLLNHVLWKMLSVSRILIKSYLLSLLLNVGFLSLLKKMDQRSLRDINATSVRFIYWLCSLDIQY